MDPTTNPPRKEPDQPRRKSIIKALTETLGINTAKDTQPEPEIEQDLVPRPLQISKPSTNAESSKGQAGQDAGEKRKTDERTVAASKRDAKKAKEYEFARRLTHKLKKVEWEREYRLRQGRDEFTGLEEGEWSEEESDKEREDRCEQARDEGAKGKEVEGGRRR